MLFLDRNDVDVPLPIEVKGRVQKTLHRLPAAGTLRVIRITVVVSDRKASPIVTWS